MPYTARKTMTLGGQEVIRGTVIPQELIDAIPELRFGAMIRTGLVEAVIDRNPQGAPEPEPVEVLCPICGEGPFAKLAQHVARKHGQTMSDIADESTPLMEAAVAGSTDVEAGE